MVALAYSSAEGKERGPVGIQSEYLEDTQTVEAPPETCTFCQLWESHAGVTVWCPLTSTSQVSVRWGPWSEGRPQLSRGSHTWSAQGRVQGLPGVIGRKFGKD